MFGRRQVVVSSLEEDLKALGLLKEEGPEKPGPKGEPTSSAAAPGRNVGALSDNPKEKGEDPTDKQEPHAGAVPPKKDLPVTPGAQAESIKGMLDKVRAGGTVGKAKPAHESLRDAVANVRSQSNRNHVESLLKDVANIIEGIDNSHRDDSVKAFANMSIISDMLYRGYDGFASKYNNADLSEAAEALASMSQEAAEIAQAVESGEAVDEEALAEEFKTQMDALIAGLELYSDLVEADEDDGDDDEDDKDKDKEKGEKDKEDDKDKEDEKEEGILPRSPLVGRDKNMKGRGVGASSGAGAAVRSTPGMRLNMSAEEGKDK